MALLLNTVGRQRIPGGWNNVFGSSSALYFYNNTIAQPITSAALGSFFDSSSFSSALIVKITGFNIGIVSDGLEFSSPPPATAATGSGTLSWCVLSNALNTGSSAKNIIGPATLAGGNGLIEITNGGEGGGSGLTVNIGDFINPTSFRLDWS